MNYRTTLTIISLFFGIPFFTHAQVLLSEIAWMGTDSDVNNEWIELYNMGTPVDLTGWTITDNNSLTISLSGTLPGPHQVGVLERTDDNTLPSITALLTYPGALVDTGRTLTLKNANGDTVDNAVGGTDWTGIGGIKTSPKKTPQRTRMNTWVTATPTPGADNAQTTDVVVATTTTGADTETTSSVTTVRKSGGGSSKRTSTQTPKENIPPKLELTIQGPKLVYVNEEVKFEALPSGIGKTLESSLKYDWNFGDTYTDHGKKVSHVYTDPGEYIVAVDGTVAKQYDVARLEVKVVPVSFTLVLNEKGDVVLTNNADYEVDLQGFTVKGGTEFTFPKLSLLKAKGKLTIPKERLTSTQYVALRDTQGLVVTSVGAGTAYVPPTYATRVTPRESESTLPETVEETESAVIQIGKTEEPVKKSVLSRFIARFAELFGS